MGPEDKSAKKTLNKKYGQKGLWQGEEVAGVTGELDHDSDHRKRQPRAGAEGDQTRGGDGAMGGIWNHPIE